MADSQAVIDIRARIGAETNSSELQKVENLYATLLNNMRSINQLKRTSVSLNEQDKKTYDSLRQSIKSGMAEIKSLAQAGAGARGAGLNLFRELESRTARASMGLTDAEALSAQNELKGVLARWGGGMQNLAALGGWEDEEGASGGRRGRGGWGGRSFGMSRFFRSTSIMSGFMRGLLYGGGGGDDDGGGALTAIGYGIKGAGITAAVTAAYKMVSFTKESVDYWRQIEKSTLTVATNVGGTTAALIRSNQELLGQGKGFGFTPAERQQANAALSRGGFAGLGGDTAAFSRMMRISMEEGAQFFGGLGPMVGARHGGGMTLPGMIAAGLKPGGMTHAPQAYMGAMQSAFGMYAQAMGPATTQQEQLQIVRMMTGVQATGAGEGAMGAQFMQQIQQSMHQPVGRLVLFDALRKRHPTWDYLQIQDAMRNPFSAENLELLQGGLRQATGGNQRFLGTVLNEMGFNPTQREAFMNLKPADIAGGGADQQEMIRIARQAMGTPGGERAGYEERRGDLEYALGARLGPAANHLADIFLKLGENAESMSKQGNWFDTLMAPLSQFMNPYSNPALQQEQ